MSRNVGNTDRIIRFILGLVVILAGLYFQTWFGALGLVFVGTALAGFCPLYTLFGISTCPANNRV